MTVRNINKYISLGAVLTAFIAIVLFGTLIMAKEAGHDGCIAARTNGGNCPITDRFFAYVNFHLNAAKGFSTGILATLAVLGAMLLFAAIPVPVAAGPSPGYIPGYCNHLSQVSSIASFQKFTRWFSLKENAPNGA